MTITMTIDRAPNATAPQNEKLGLPFAQPSALGGEVDANTTRKSVFSSVLSAMTDGGADPADLHDADILLAPDGAQALAQPTQDAGLAPDSAAVLAQLIESICPEVAGLAQGQSGEAGTDQPGTQPDAAINAPTGMRRHGTVPTLPEPAEEGGIQAPDAGFVSSQTKSTVMRRQLPAGSQNTPLVAPLLDGAMVRAGDGQQGGQDGAGAIRADWRATSAVMAERAAFMMTPSSDSASGGFRAFAAPRGSDRASGRAIFLPLEGAAPGSPASSSYSTTVLASAAAPTATAETPMAPSASSEVAHKVHYWITRGVQTAGLQLDALSGSALDVSIILQGKEAHVEFRSDQPEARRLLQEAMPQLRDLLRSEGLQLVGGFVGSSAQEKQGNARRDSQYREPARGGAVSVSAAEAVRTGQAGAASTHTLDVFV